MALFSCENVTFGYGKEPVLKNLSFHIDEGDYLCVVGENGSGKTTLMKTCLGLLNPLSGRINLAEGLKPTEIGYLPQQTTIQRDFPASCKEIVLSGCLNRCGWHPFYSKDDRHRATENIDRMGITHLANRCYSELSGGQQQRVLLARALCATQKMLLLDEPVAGLDPRVTEEMYTLIQQLNHDGITIMMITHDMQTAIQHATRILDIGRQPAFFGTPKDYRHADLRIPHQEVHA